MSFSNLRIVVFPETTKTWVARSLEHDLSASGRTADAAIEMLMKMVDAHLAYDIRHGHRPLAAFASAPRLYWQAFVSAPKKEAPIELNRTEPERRFAASSGLPHRIPPQTNHAAHCVRRCTCAPARHSVHFNDPIVGAAANDTGARAHPADDIPAAFITFELRDNSGNGDALVRGRLECRAHAFRDGPRHRA